MLLPISPIISNWGKYTGSTEAEEKLKEWRLLNDVVSDIDNQIGARYSAVQLIVVRQGCIAQKERVAFIDHPFSHLRCKEGDTRILYEVLQHL